MFPSQNASTTPRYGRHHGHHHEENSSPNDDEEGFDNTAVQLHDILAPTHWVDKNERVACGDCGHKFNNLFRRRHHCRLCGDLFCKQCVVQKLLRLPRQDKIFVKVCRPCATEETCTTSSSSSAKSPRHHAKDSRVTLRSTSQSVISRSSPSLGQQQPHPLRERRPTDGQSPARSLHSPLGNDVDRVAVLRGYSIDYDATPHVQLTQLCDEAADRIRCPIAAIGFMETDTQHLHASVGLYLSMMPRSMAWMCDAVVATNRPLIVLDAMQDSRYRHSPLVRNHHVRFYAAVPVATSNGFVLGTLAVMDTTPREYVDIEPLVALAGSIMTFLRKAKAKARKRRTLSFDSAVNAAPGGLRSREANSESMIMTLVSNTAQTQVTLAEQQGALASALGDHTDKISRLVQAIARMESKLGRNDVRVDDDETKPNHV